MLSDAGLQKEVRIVEYGQVIAVNPTLTVDISRLFDPEFTKDKTLMDRSIYAVRETDDAIRIIVYDRQTMMRCSDFFRFHDNFSVLILPETPDDAQELVDGFDLNEYKTYVSDFRKKYRDILFPKEERERMK